MTFERFVETGSMTVLARALHAESVPTPDGKRFDAAGLYRLLYGAKRGN